MSPISVGGSAGLGCCATENGANSVSKSSNKVGKRGCQSCGYIGDHSSVPFDSHPASIKCLGVNEHDFKRFWRCLQAAGKGFVIGAGLKGGLALFAILVRLKSRRSKGAFARKIGEITTNAEAMLSAAKETLRYGLFLATFAGTFVSVDELIAAILGHRRSAFILKQESLPSTYRAFLNKHGGKTAAILQGLKELSMDKHFTNLDVIEKHYKSMGFDLKLDPNMKVPCSIIHGNLSCTWHFVSFIVQEYGRALPVYLPVYFFPALIVHRQGLVKRPYTILAKTLIGTAKSSLFLSVYCASAWAWTCLLFRTFGRCNVPLVAAGTFMTGMAVGIEKKSRRMEISLYCLTRAIESFFTCVADAGFLPQASRLKRADVAVFSLATAIIMHCYARERDVFRSKYLNVLDWVFGVPPSPPF